MYADLFYPIDETQEFFASFNFLASIAVKLMTEQTKPHLLSPNTLQQEDLPLNSCVYLILVQYPLIKVRPPDAMEEPHPYDVT